MSEFQELVKDAPQFVSMERGELVTYAYAMFAAGTKADSENAKLRELVRDMWEGYNDPRCEDCPLKNNPSCVDCPICAREAAVIDRMRELGIEVEA